MIPLQARDLTLRLNRHLILDAISLTLAPGQMVGVLGPNGAGKTSLVKTLAGLTGKADIQVMGHALHTLSPKRRARLIAYLPQAGDGQWSMSVRDVVALGRLPHGPTPKDGAIIARALAETDCQALAERPLTKLSGGERARALLARALAVEAPVLLADEPVAHLDPGHQLQMLSLLRRRAETGLAVVVVLHDLALASRFCHRVVVLDQGRMAVDGPPDQVLDDALIARVFGISVVRGRQDGTAYLLPWQELA